MSMLAAALLTARSERRIVKAFPGLFGFPPMDRNGPCL
jgi:hypothetical protein